MTAFLYRREKGLKGGSDFLLSFSWLWFFGSDICTLENMAFYLCAVFFQICVTLFWRVSACLSYYNANGFLLLAGNFWRACSWPLGSGWWKPKDQDGSSGHCSLITRGLWLTKLFPRLQTYAELLHHGILNYFMEYNNQHWNMVSWIQVLLEDYIKQELLMKRWEIIFRMKKVSKTTAECKLTAY